MSRATKGLSSATSAVIGRTEQQPGLQCCGTALLLEVEALQEYDAVKGCHGDQCNGQGGGDRSRAKQIKWDHRRPPPELDDQERRER